MTHDGAVQMFHQLIAATEFEDASNVEEAEMDTIIGEEDLIS